MRLTVALLAPRGGEEARDDIVLDGAEHGVGSTRLWVVRLDLHGPLEQGDGAPFKGQRLLETIDDAAAVRVELLEKAEAAD